MADATFNNPTGYGAYAPTTNVWDVTELYQTDVNSPEFKELLVRLYQNLNLLATIVNLKDTGYYDLQEFVNGQQYFPNPALSSTTTTMPTYRPVYRKVLNFGQLNPSPGTKLVNHNITCTSATSFTRIYGVATDPVALSYIPIPYVSVAGGTEIELFLTGTQVGVITASNRSAYTICYIVLEYLQT